MRDTKLSKQLVIIINFSLKPNMKSLLREPSCLKKCVTQNFVNNL